MAKKGAIEISDIMSRKIVTVELDDSLKVIQEIFNHTHFHHLIVVSAERVAGVISDRDLLKALSPRIGTFSETDRDTTTLNKRAHQIMTRHPITLPASAGIFDAINTFNQHSISCIPIVDSALKPVGMLSWRDILKMLEEQREKRNAQKNT